MADSCAPVQIRPSKGTSSKASQPLKVWVVRVWEIDPPEGQERLEWILLTNEPVTSFTAAYRVVEWYECRWIIEVINSLFVNNQAQTGSAIRSTGISTNPATTVISGTLFADNDNTIAADVRHLFHDGAGSITSWGNNLSDQAGYGPAGAPNLNQTNDHVDTNGPDHVVTSMADTFDHADDNRTLSLREAIDLANLDEDTLEEIWAPAWNFVLTRDRGTHPTDTNVGYGDLDISDKLIVRGISTGTPETSTRRQWRLGVIDKQFELLGDYDENGLAFEDVDGRDYLIYQQTFGSTTDLRADGNDDGIINGLDGAIGSENYGNTFQLFDVLLV